MNTIQEVIETHVGLKLEIECIIDENGRKRVDINNGENIFSFFAVGNELFHIEGA